MKQRYLIGACVLSCLTAAHAQDNGGSRFYVGGKVGASFMQDLKLKSIDGVSVRSTIDQVKQLSSSMNPVFSALAGPTGPVGANTRFDTVLQNLENGIYDASLTPAVLTSAGLTLAQVKTYANEIRNVSGAYFDLPLPVFGYYDDDIGAVEFNNSLVPAWNSAVPMINGMNDKISLDPGVAFTLSGGYKLSDKFAVELESGMSYNSADKLFNLKLKDFDTKIGYYTVPLLVNGVYSFTMKERWHPYLGAGVGVVFTGMSFKADDYKKTAWDASFGYQAKAGLQYDISSRVSVGVEYSFMGTTSHDWKFEETKIKTDASMLHNVFATFKVSF